MLDLNRSLSIYNETRERIAVAFELDKDDQAVIDTASGETNLEELLAAALREARMAGEMAEGAKRIIDATRARQERLKLKADGIRKAVAWAFAEAGLQRITAPDLTASMGHGRPKMTIDEDRLPAAFKDQIVSYKPNRDRIQAAVDVGNVPDGVQISNSEPVLTVRVK